MRALSVLALVLVAAYAVRAPGHWGGARLDEFFVQWVYDATAAIGMVLCTWRAVRVPTDRVIWSLIAAAFVLEVGADVLNTALYGASTAPQPSAGDVLWLAFYAPMLVALGLHIRRAGGARGTVALDVVITIAALGSISAAFVVDAIVAGGSSSTLALVTAVAYPVLDLVLVALVIQLGLVRGWRLSPATWLMAACFLCWAATDTIYALQSAQGTYVSGGLLDLGWVVPFALFGVAAWMRYDEPHAPQGPQWRALAVPVGFAVAALAMIVVAASVRISPVSLGLAAAGLACVIVRFAVTFRSYLVVLASAEREAATDALTGLGNRRSLLADLQLAVDEGRGAILLLFDLNGFKGYNDLFGHLAGDALLARLGRSLREAVGPAGSAYRMGGDEFCVLLDHDEGERRISAACAALTERGEGFAIAASHGRVTLPDEARDPSDALRLADQRMYHAKSAVRGPAAEQTTHALLRVLAERHPDLGDHSAGVAELAEAVARRLNMSAQGVQETRSAAELHDIGKAAIPDNILVKPGPLNDDEWAFMRRHTVIGQRILASAPALAGVAKLVRASHERWDGGGYPDQIAGDAIPLGARIVAVCDAFDAMLSNRPYSAPLGVPTAIAELERCAGSQFDPQVVEAFVAVLEHRAASPQADGAPTDRGRREPHPR